MANTSNTPVYILAAIAVALAITLAVKHATIPVLSSDSDSDSDSGEDYRVRRKVFRRTRTSGGRRVIATGPSKCFSCEAQDDAVYGDVRNYGSKCFSCERQDQALYGHTRSYGTKCFRCEADPAIHREVKNF